ncbi:hypothetical protein N658DRAFT_50632 [Parathielavia hyrcaniae]|uniref:PNPLA domain-containing protein n=1 Tax=Parathielavia hyrcaniae TaxID=113614 RepID=A0AAN6Q188_9PEZI|nr:hypothetical protein N658DRAFT_50632 [Parathielavia hyrcaniae]
MYWPPQTAGQDQQCRTFVLAGYKAVVNSGRPHLFKSYDRHDRTTIWEASRATTAATGFFEAMPIGNTPVRYIDAGLGINNFGRAAFEEAKRLWPNRDIGVFLSLGTGRETVASLPVKKGLLGFGSQMKQIKQTPSTSGSTLIKAWIRLAWTSGTKTPSLPVAQAPISGARSSRI